MKKATLILCKIIRKIILGIIYLLVGIYMSLLVPMFWGNTPLVVITGSMEPTFSVGSIIYYEKINPTKFEKNDILVWQNNAGDLISHRIVDINEKYEFTTKGDANNTVDSEKVQLSQVIGRAKEFKIPFIGFYVTFINNHLFIIYLLVGIILLDYFIAYIYYKVKLVKYDNKNIVPSISNYQENDGHIKESSLESDTFQLTNRY